MQVLNEKILKLSLASFQSFYHPCGMFPLLHRRNRATQAIVAASTVFFFFRPNANRLSLSKTSDIFHKCVNVSAQER